MTAPEPTRPTAEHIDAVARAISTREWGEWNDSHHPDDNRWTWDGDGRTDMERAEFRVHAKTILTSTDPAVHEALAASLPADVMLDALVRAGVLTPERHCAHARAAQADGDYRSYTCEDAGTHCPPPRLVTPWEVAP